MLGLVVETENVMKSVIEEIIIRERIESDHLPVKICLERRTERSNKAEKRIF